MDIGSDNCIGSDNGSDAMHSVMTPDSRLVGETQLKELVAKIRALAPLASQDALNTVAVELQDTAAATSPERALQAFFENGWRSGTQEHVLNVDTAQVDQPPPERIFTVGTSGASLPLRHTSALECGTLKYMIEEMEHDRTEVPFDKVRTFAALVLIERLSARAGETAAARRHVCAQLLEIGGAAELVEIALFLEHRELLRVVQMVFAQVLEPIETPAAMRAMLDVTSGAFQAEDATALLLTAPAHTGASAAAASSSGATSTLSLRLRTDDAAEACLLGCTGGTLRRLLSVSSSWAQRAHGAAASVEWTEAHISDDGVAEIGWAVDSPAAEDLSELLRRLPDRVVRLRTQRGEEVDVGPLLAARVLHRQAIHACISPRQEGHEPASLRYAAALFVILKSRVLTEMGDAFRGCTSLTTLTLPEGLTTIDRGAFAGCTSLATLSLPKGLITIGGSAFAGCTSLTTLTLPEGLITIGVCAFLGCTSLATLTLPEGLNTIGGSAFDCCTSLATLTLPKGLTTIDRGAFWDCTSLATPMPLPLDLQVGMEAFGGDGAWRRWGQGVLQMMGRGMISFFERVTNKRLRDQVISDEEEREMRRARH